MAAFVSPPAGHIVIFPWMAPGHTLPLLDLSKALARRRLQVTIITTPLNAPSIQSKLSRYPLISLSVIPFPRSDQIPENCENTADLPSTELVFPFITTVKKMKSSFESVLEEMIGSGSRPLCVISDFFLYWTLDSCRSFKIPRLVFNGMGVFTMLLINVALVHGSCNLGPSKTAYLQLPGLSLPLSLTRNDFPDPIWSDNPIRRLMLEVAEADAGSWGVILNSFEELESDYVAQLDSRYGAWCVGPLFLHAEDHHVTPSDPNMKWLDERGAAASVVFVSFGTQGHISEAQMNEIAIGLEKAGEPFIWTLRSNTWAPPDGWEESIRGKGLVVREWVDQRSILAHPSVGGFVSHCGWNSVIESLTNGVPLLTWPSGADQRLNAKLLVDILGVAIPVPLEYLGEDGIAIVGWAVICEVVKELMRGERGRKAREKAQELSVVARKAVEKGGSSDRRLDKLIESLGKRTCGNEI